MAIKTGDREDRLFLARDRVAFRDESVQFDGCAGFSRAQGASVRLMVTDGVISSGGVTLKSARPAALQSDGKTAHVLCLKGDPTPEVTFAKALGAVRIEVEAVDSNGGGVSVTGK